MMDEWVRLAMTNDMVVVELLLRLKQAQASAAARPQAVIPLRWGLRLPRSRSGTAGYMRCDVVSRRKEGDSSTRCSPTTPLSWSGGGGAASPSATADGYEESSHHGDRSPSGGVRSKGSAAIETTSTSAKRSRKKKTFAELKVEEGMLLKEQVHLEKELANLRATFKEYATRNESLKRIKIDLNSHSTKDLSIASDVPEKTECSQLHQRGASFLGHSSTVLQNQPIGDNHLQSDSCETHKIVSNHDRFLLPDLNMMPSEQGLLH